MNIDLFLSVVAVLVLARTVVGLFQYLRSPLRRVQGPWAARMTSGWYAWKIWQGSFQECNQEMHKKYGSIVRYAPNRYSISDLSAVKIIYGLGAPFPKSTWYTTWASPGQHSLFNDQSMARHAHDRKQYQAMYSMSSLVHYEEYVDHCADLFKNRLSELCAASTVDLRHWFQCYAFDVIGMITYGKRLGFLDAGTDVGGVISALEDHLGYATLVGIWPSMHKILFPLRNLVAGGGGKGRAYVMAFTKEKMREAQSRAKAVDPEDMGESMTQDFLGKFLAKHSADPDRFTSFHVLAGCVSNMVAGSDTTAISLSAIMYHLLRNPECMDKVRAEVDQFVAEGKLSRYPTYKESLQMPYFQAAIKEALRLHPATGLPLERVVPKGGATIAGQFFPEGAIVGINTWVAHHDTEVFGLDAAEFKPERWLQDDTEKIALMNRFWMPFGLGSRTCIGRHISMLEICKLIPVLIRDFDFSLHETLRQEEWHTQNYWFVKPVDFQVQLRKRESSL
ncbi:cytochrome P450 [Plectosphaerella plurivora]|uniref:Cytochrome P450 n=1 Tax=Plectosphaerella plurivora TaxID=936078 RepID=A0A9P8V752_9PEZI|nr:cytochrome P450 [Plectosphaerella plurivora]